MSIADLKKKFNHIHVFGILALLSTMVSAFCISLLTYIIQTKEIPFGLNAEKKDANTPIKKLAKENNEAPQNEKNKTLLVHERRNEAILENYYKALKQQRIAMELEKKNVEEEHKSVNEVLTRSAVIQQTSLKTQENIKKLLIQIKVEEENNIKGICDLVTTMNAPSGAKMLLQQDNQMIARVLYFLPKKKSALLIEQIVNDNTNSSRMKDIYQVLHKLTKKDLSAIAGENNG